VPPHQAPRLGAHHDPIGLLVGAAVDRACERPVLGEVAAGDRRPGVVICSITMKPSLDAFAASSVVKGR
jgi:hypothetical protein